MTIGHRRSPTTSSPAPGERGSPLVESQVPAVRRVAQQLEGVDERVERGIVGRHGVDDHDPATGPQHSGRLAHGGGDVRPVVGAVPADDAVEGRVGEGEGSHVGTDRGVAAQPALVGEQACRRQHLLRGVHRGHDRACRRDGEAGMPGPAAKVEDAIARAGSSASTSHAEVGPGGVDRARRVGGGHAVPVGRCAGHERPVRSGSRPARRASGRALARPPNALTARPPRGRPAGGRRAPWP